MKEEKIPDLIKKRILFLFDSIDEDSARSINEMIYRINMFDDKQEKTLKEFVRRPIQIHINSYGGSVYDGFSIVNAIELSKTPIYTVASGACMSMGLIILLAGHKRYMQPNATLMYHEISSFNGQNNLEEQKRNVSEMERLQGIMDSYLLKRTIVKPAELKAIRKQMLDWYIDDKQAIKNKFIDKVINTLYEI